jgi:hypothetical protein
MVRLRAWKPPAPLEQVGIAAASGMPGSTPAQHAECVRHVARHSHSGVFEGVGATFSSEKSLDLNGFSKGLARYEARVVQSCSSMLKTSRSTQ